MEFIGSPVLMAVDEVRAHPELQYLFCLSRDAIKAIAANIKERGFDASEALILGQFPSGDGAVVEGLVDGYQRKVAAIEAGSKPVWVQLVRFDSIDEAIEYAEGKHKTRRKAGDGDILFALCVHHAQLGRHGGMRSNGESPEGKIEDSNLPSGVSHRMYHRLTNGDIAKLYGVQKHRVDHVRSKYFRHLVADEIDAIRHNQSDKCDPHQLIQTWDPERHGVPVKKPADKTVAPTEPTPLAEQVATQEPVENEAVPRARLLDLLPLVATKQDRLSEMAMAAGLTVEALVAQWILEKMEETTDHIPRGSSESKSDHSDKQTLGMENGECELPETPPGIME